VKRFLIADCDMVALAVVQERAEHKRETETAFVASGNRPSSKTIDFSTSNHAWNIFAFEESFRSLRAGDYTPASSLKLSLVFNEKTLGWVLLRLSKLNATNWSVSTKEGINKKVFDELPAAIPGSRESIQSGIDQAIAELIEQIFTPDRFSKFEDGCPAKICRKEKATGNVVAVAVTPTIINYGRIGESMFTPADREVWHLPIDHLRTPFFGMNTSGSLFSRFKAELISAKEEGASYLWPKIAKADYKKYLPLMLQNFPGDKDQEVIRMVNDGTIAPIDSYGHGIMYMNGKFVVHNYSLYSPGKDGPWFTRPDPTPEQLAQFWRSQGFATEPMLSYTGEAFVYQE
jgi:hypothetical protein